MTSAIQNCTLRAPHDPVADHVSAFRVALELFGVAELSEFLPPPDHPQYREILGQLVRLELERSWKTGEPVSLESYQARYPEVFADAVFARQIAGDEQLWREVEQPCLSADESSLTVKTFGPISQIEATRTHGSGPDGAPALPASGPEVFGELTEVMFEMPKVGDEFLDFSLLVELGKGAFGKVFLAQQGPLASRLVALKVATGLFGESQTLAQLQHTHIVPIYSYHHAQPYQAVCMPYLGSTTLADVLADIRSQKSLPSSGRDILSTLNERKRRSTLRFDDSLPKDAPQALSDSAPAQSGAARAALSPLLEVEGLSYVDAILWLAVRLTDGLAHAHERGILHRDLKPANILLTDEGVPMLLDFNLAQNTKSGNDATAIGGTLPYMAPEHLEAFRKTGGHVDERSDLFSLGVVLFELLTGVAPFPSYHKLPMRQAVERMIVDRREKTPLLRTLNRAIPPAVEAIVRRCLSADPAGRYQSARQLQEDLQCQLEHRPLQHAANPSWRERFWKFRRRHPRLMSVTSAAVLALVAIASLASAFAVREDQRLRLQAQSTLARFDGDAQSAYFLLNARTAAAHLDEGERTCRATLRHFDVLDNPAWQEAGAVKRLPAAERERLRADVGQLLVLLAQARQLAGATSSSSSMIVGNGAPPVVERPKRSGITGPGLQPELSVR